MDGRLPMFLDTGYCFAVNVIKGPKLHVVGENKYVIAAKSVSASILECTRKHVFHVHLQVRNRRKYLKGLMSLP